MDVRECLRDEDYWKMPVSWRFGWEVCRFLRETSTGYGGQGAPLLSPLDCPSEYTTDELKRIPDTKMKCVMCSGLWYYASPGRGRLEARAQLLSPSMTETGVSSARVGASVAMFVNLAREALCFFSWAEGGTAQWNQHSSFLNFDDVGVTVATVFYMKDMLVHFDEYRRGLLKIPEIRHEYGLSEVRDYERLWLVLTPETVSGDTVLLCQRCILPRVLSQGDMRGNLKCEGRRNVTYDPGS
jgi:hypothetical protein